MTLWQIEARKYDGRLHYSLPAELIEDDGERLWFRSQRGGLLQHFTRGWTEPITRPSDMIFWRGRWYNIYSSNTPTGELTHYYCNAGLPPTLSDQTISFVDLDLDVRLMLDGQIEVLDEDEFIEHAALFGYPEAIQRGARQAIDDVIVLWRARQFPFDGSLER
jgi:protein associated with RNAse G/E